ncbi:MAG TPA: hypothetical protein VGR08_12420 [Thermomicrobiales bacterium]|nr:hypothetical protein [Thermomicrobiales bacterium]
MFNKWIGSVTLFMMVFGMLALTPGIVTAQENVPIHPTERCRNGGYEAVTNEQGVRFKNPGQCRRHVVLGGELLPSITTPSRPTIERVFNHDWVEWCESAFDLKGFPAYTDVHVTIDGLTLRSGEKAIWEFDVRTDVNGFASAGGGSVDPGTTIVTATFATIVGSVTVTQTFSC